MKWKKVEKSKKTNKEIKNTNKGTKKVLLKKLYIIIISITLVLTISVLTFFAIRDNLKKKSLQSSNKNIEEETYEQGDINQIDIDEIINRNTQNNIREELLTEEIDLEYITIYKNNENIPKGKIQVLQEGRDGKQTVVTKKTFSGDELIKEEQTGNVVTKSSINKIVEVGTSKYYSNYKPKKGDVLYVTSYTLNIMREASIESEKVTTFTKDMEVKLLEINKNWYKISRGHYEGWADSDCLTYINPNSSYEGTTKPGVTLSKTELLSRLNKNMDISKPSGFSLEQFKKVLANNSNDKNKIFEKNAEYFYYIEKQYNINGIFVASVGIHESNWGKSKIAIDKKNLFGYGANDSNPYNNAYNFENHSEGIDLIARVFVKYYLNPSGTKIYESQIASGKYYSGKTVKSVNKYYATDKLWSDSVYKWMTHLYNNL